MFTDYRVMSWCHKADGSKNILPKHKLQNIRQFACVGFMKRYFFKSVSNKQRTSITFAHVYASKCQNRNCNVT